MNRLLGRTFLHPLYDYLLIGGGLSLIVIPFIWLVFGDRVMIEFSLLPWFILFSNSAHFAASTVRLYTKPGTQESLPFLTMIFPLIALGIVSVALFVAEDVGRYFQILYLTWSPYHYAAQAYGLAVMYAFRSGCQLLPQEKKWLKRIAILPFAKVALITVDKHALAWILPPELLWQDAVLRIPLARIAEGIGFFGMLAPVVWFAMVRKRHPQPPPFISLLVILTNAVWFAAFSYLNAFIWSTIFHGIQYLSIVIIFHVRDQTSRPGNRHSAVYHVLWFYLVSVMLGYALFNCWPYGYVLMGFGLAESVLLVVAAINLHHFIVDAYIWKLPKGDSNRAIVDGQPAH